MNEHFEVLDTKTSNRGARSNSSKGTNRKSNVIPPPLHTKQFRVPKPSVAQEMNSHKSASNLFAPANALGTFKSAKVTKRQKSLTRRSSVNLMPARTATTDHLGLPKIEDISYMNLKAQQLIGKNHDDCHK